jgi:hypothetical protein
MAGVKNQRRDDSRSDADVDLLGIRAEMAVAKAYGLNFNPYNLGIDEGSDMFSDEIGIDVKASFHREGKLVFKSVDAFKADLAVFVTDCPEDDRLLRIAGWITQSRFKGTCQAHDMGGGKRAAAVTQADLASPEKLWAFLTNSRSAV